MKKFVFSATSALCDSLLAILVATAVENERAFVDVAPIETVNVSVVPHPDSGVITIMEDTIKNNDTQTTCTANLWEMGRDGALFHSSSTSLYCESMRDIPQRHFSTNCLTEDNRFEHSTKPESFMLIVSDNNQ